MAVSSNFAFKIVTKPLQIETWLLLTAYSNTSSPYLTMILLIPYYVWFSHNTCVTDDRQMDKRQTTQSSYQNKVLTQRSIKNGLKSSYCFLLQHGHAYNVKYQLVDMCTFKANLATAV